MASTLFPSTIVSSIIKPRKTVQRIVFAGPHDRNIARQVAKGHPLSLKYDYLRPLTNNCGGETHTRRADKLKEDVGMMLEKVEKPLEKLKFIDTVQRLGISYHFEDDIRKILKSTYTENYSSSMSKERSLHATALEFRLLRQQGFHVPQEVFNDFKDETGNFNACLCKDIEGLLCVYEASYLSLPGENILDEARDFSVKYLKEMNQNERNDDISLLVDHALEVPLHWRMQRMEARWFIDVYERKLERDSTLLELAKLDFNMVQAAHQEDLKHMLSWWKSTGLGEELGFARDRLMENFLWTVGGNFKPQFQSFRRIATKLICLITILDDVYDAYSTLPELELFTDAIERWEINEIEKLPDYMKICFHTIHNSIHEMAYVTLKEQDFCSISYLKNAWANLCKSYLLEAKWRSSGYTPSLEEYLSTALISVGGPLTLVHTYFSIANPIRKEALEYLENYTNVIRWSSLILRLSNDLGISQDGLSRDDNPKSIQCYMQETGSCKNDARKHMNHLIDHAWKNMNKDRGSPESPFDQEFTETAVNFARTGQYIYQHGDGHGTEDSHAITLLLINPIPLS